MYFTSHIIPYVLKVTLPNPRKCHLDTNSAIKSSICSNNENTKCLFLSEKNVQIPGWIVCVLMYKSCFIFILTSNRAAITTEQIVTQGFASTFLWVKWTIIRWMGCLDGFLQCYERKEKAKPGAGNSRTNEVYKRWMYWQIEDSIGVVYDCFFVRQCRVGF